jgi:hypothetical protein
MVAPNTRGACIIKTTEVHKLTAAKRGTEPTVSRLELAENEKSKRRMNPVESHKTPRRNTESGDSIALRSSAQLTSGGDNSHRSHRSKTEQSHLLPRSYSSEELAVRQTMDPVQRRYHGAGATKPVRDYRIKRAPEHGEIPRLPSLFRVYLSWRKARAELTSSPAWRR